MGGPFWPNDIPTPPQQDRAVYHATGLIDGVVIPVLKSLFLGFVTGVFAGVLVFALNLDVGPATVFFLTCFGVMGLSFLAYSARGQWLIERICGADLNMDGYIGQPQIQEPEPARTIRVELTQDEGRRGDFIDLPYPEKLPRLAAGLIQGRQFSQDSCAWILSKRQFNTLRDEMVSRGLAIWKNPEAHAQGVEFTAAGRAILRRLADLPPTLPDGK